MLPLVHARVHVANDRELDARRPTGEPRHRADLDHLVHRGGERDRRTGEAGDPRAPDAAGDHHRLGLDVAACRANPPDPSALDVEAEDLGVREHPERAFGPAALTHDRPRPQRVDDSGRGRVEAADDHRLLDVGDELLHLRRCHERRRLDSPRDRRGEPAPELLEALLGPGNLDAAARGEDAELLYWRTLSSVSWVTSREWSTGKMKLEAWPVEPPGFGKRALVKEHHAVPAEPAQVVGDAVTDDPRPDHDRLRSRR